jgi:hypothetical protein
VSPTSPWTVLGIEPTADVTAIRRAYAAVLKRTNPDDDPIGFATLRGAYEHVLARARASTNSSSPPVPSPALSLPADTSPDSYAAAAPTPLGPTLDSGTAAALQDSPDAPADAASAAAMHEAPDTNDLRARFLAFQHAVTAPEAPSPEALHELLEACLRAPALESLGVALEFEPVMVRFLAQTLPRTECLLNTVIERWQWRERPRTGASADINMLVAHADNLRKLDNLQYSEPRVHRALTRPPRAWLLWPQIMVFRLDTGVRSAFEELQGAAPSGIDPRALDWWMGFFHRPHLRPELVRFSANMSFLVMWFTAHFSHDIAWRDILLNGLYVCGAGFALAVLWLLLVDWPRYFQMQRRHAAGDDPE